MLPRPELARQNRVSVEEITGEVTFGKLSLDEFDDIVVEESDLIDINDLAAAGKTSEEESNQNMLECMADFLPPLLMQY